jgi:hypothetical protein
MAMIANTLMGDERGYFVSNVPDHLSPLAFGAEGAQAASVTKVPKAWGLGASARSAICLNPGLMFWRDIV